MQHIYITGSVLACVCSDSKVSLLDPHRMPCTPLTRKKPQTQSHTQANTHSYKRALIYQWHAHTDAVNVCTFITEHQFLTGSDDCTMRHWDMRYLTHTHTHAHGTHSQHFSTPVCVYEGHNGWVKNIYTYR